MRCPGALLDLDISTLDLESYDALDFYDLNALIEQLRAGVAAAELHGMLTAGLCIAGIEPDYSAVLQECLRFAGENVQASMAEQQELAVFIVQTRLALEDENFGFTLLLPDDDSAINERARALGLWCEGFMYGFAIAEKERGINLSQNSEIGEILQDFAAISRVDSDANAEIAGDEQDLLQLVEYVRVATMNVFAQCAGEGQSPSPGSGSGCTVH